MDQLLLDSVSKLSGWVGAHDDLVDSCPLAPELGGISGTANGTQAAAAVAVLERGAGFEPSSRGEAGVTLGPESAGCAWQVVAPRFGVRRRTSVATVVLQNVFQISHLLLPLGQVVPENT